MDNQKEAERIAAINEYYRVYRDAQRRTDLRAHSHFSIYDDGFIEIWEYKDDKRVKCVCKVKNEDETECYKRATEEVRNFDRDRRKARYEAICS